MNPVYPVDIIGEIVASVQADVLLTIQTNETNAIGSTLIQNLNYQYGPVEELLETLSQMDKDPNSQKLKYPLVWLILDMKERRGRTVGFYAEAPMRIVIAHQTNQNFKTTERYEKVFKPVLYPIYYNFLEKASQHRLLNNSVPELIIHDKIDHVFWGTQEAGGGKSKISLSDFLDAIELDNMLLDILFDNCPQG